jgi:AAA+ superfamily predicted ATPase
MIDEIDAIGLSRGQSNDVGEMARIVITLMQEIDQLTNKTIVLGATNRIQDIDAALRRRFTREHEVLPLTKEESHNLVVNYLNDCGYYDVSENFIEETSKIKKQSDIIKQIISFIVKNAETELN